MNRPAAPAGRRGLAVGALVIMLALAGCGGTDGSVATPARNDPSATTTQPAEPYADDVQAPDASADGSPVPEDGQVSPTPDVAATPEPGLETNADRLADRNLDQVQRGNFDRSMDSINQWNEP